MVFTLKCSCLAVLFCLVTGVEAVAHERLSSPAFDPLSGFETRRLRVNQRYLQNTLEQILVFVAGLFGLAVYSPDGSAMRAVLATTVVWILARFAFSNREPKHERDRHSRRDGSHAGAALAYKADSL
jgi:O-antigen/teichoic acid export membrane protein